MLLLCRPRCRRAHCGVVGQFASSSTPPCCAWVGRILVRPTVQSWALRVVVQAHCVVVGLFASSLSLPSRCSAPRIVVGPLAWLLGHLCRCWPFVSLLAIRVVVWPALSYFGRSRCPGVCPVVAWPIVSSYHPRCRPSPVRVVVWPAVSFSRSRVFGFS